MSKDDIERIISKYIKKVYGFALSKLHDIDKAEELASRIIFEVYNSLLQLENIEAQNLDGYVYRISRNVYARYVNEAKIESDFYAQGAFAYREKPKDFFNERDYQRLRDEIAYLAKTQREIVVMHYYHKLKLNEIGKKLNLSLGTVKWHLYEARSQLKEGFMKVERKETIGMNPIRFSSIRQIGVPGYEGPTVSDDLSKLIVQNIIFVAYNHPKSITEIAKEIGIPSAFIEDEILYLESNGYLNKLSGGKYLSNVYIQKITKEVAEKSHLLYSQYAKIICDEYIPSLFEAMKKYDKQKIYVPNDDFNFLMWSIVTFSIGRKFGILDWYENIKKYRVKRINGGENIAYAFLEEDFNLEELNYDYKKYLTNVPTNTSYIHREYPVHYSQLNTFYDSRNYATSDIKNTDYYNIYDYMNGKISKTFSNIDKFKRLYDIGFLVYEEDQDLINLIVTTMTWNELIEIFPKPDKKFKSIGQKFDKEIYELHKNLYPPHMQGLCKDWNINKLASEETRVRVLEQLLKRGVLKPLTDDQKRTVNTIMFADVLPKKYSQNYIFNKSDDTIKNNKINEVKMKLNYSERIQKQLDRVGASIEHWEYRTLPAVRFIGIEIYWEHGYDGLLWETTRKKVSSVLDSMPDYVSGFDYDLTLTHHFGKKVEIEHCHVYIGRFMKADTPVPEGFVHWDFVPDDKITPYLTFCSQLAFSVLVGDHDTLHNQEGFDVNALYDVTRNIILEQKVTIPYPEIYWTAEVQFDRADGTLYNPENLFDSKVKPNEVRCGMLFSVYNINKGKLS